MATASKQTVLKAAPRRAAAADREAEKERIEKAEERAVLDKVAAQEAVDKFRELEVLTNRNFVISQSLTQCFGQKVIDHYKGDVGAIPKWRFTRRYLGKTIVVLDLFRKQKEYDDADVEHRRAMVERFGGAYAACGPFHTRFPHQDEKLRAKWPSAQEQLEASIVKACKRAKGK